MVDARWTLRARRGACASTLIALSAAAAATPVEAAPRVPMPANVSVTYAPCPGYPDALGCADVGHDCSPADTPAGAAHVYVRDRRDHETRYHELGHIWAAQVLTEPEDRPWFARRLGRPAGEWCRGPGQVSASELFAETYARCATRLRASNLVEEGAYGFHLAGQDLRQLCAAIQVLGLVRG
jgi:hypothetical protein